MYSAEVRWPDLRIRFILRTRLTRQSAIGARRKNRAQFITRLCHRQPSNNNLGSNRQWAYRSGYSTEYLLMHLTEKWRRTVDSGKVVAAAFIDLKKAFDSGSHVTLWKKLRRDFGITNTLLDRLCSCLNERQQFTVLNGVRSDQLLVTISILRVPYWIQHCLTYLQTTCHRWSNQGCYICSPMTQQFSVEETQQIWQSRSWIMALHEVYTGFQNNQLTPHPGKSEVLLLSTRNLIGPFAPSLLGGSNLRWVSKHAY